ncbi:Aste57867_20699 [Aphanomyces stellatus]|uniref:alpha-1,2-Mannosidase n=1 Tax=Aphanomyces stellatus TaxID=120398 RepID=A0A485LFK7_9STRA|nr:hypothetical protein As57867_020631 [Aphanomyces stellatus]VFT97379.1 Aste57867_20699 [Aphanomyces stellatus]
MRSVAAALPALAALFLFASSAEDIPTDSTNDLGDTTAETDAPLEKGLDTSSMAGVCRSFHTSGSWWTYEWCHEKHVRQYAVDRARDEETDSIFLGFFKGKSTGGGNGASASLRAYTTHLFLHGDMCNEGSPSMSTQVSRNRSAEVRFSCCSFRPTETYIESVAEPRLCDYVVHVCTPDACASSQSVGNAATAVEDMAPRKEELAETVKRMFYHAYENYMTYAFPLDNLKPISCQGEAFELGKLPMLTLIDTLDTLVIFGDAAEFRRAVGLVTTHATFDLDTEVSVFETTIRVLGGLLSSHLFAADPTLALFNDSSVPYDGGLLRLAVDLADRLLPAFLTPTGIPYGTVNLRHGVPKGETPIASTAGAGSLTMEFTMLSVLTKNPIYAKAAREAVRGLFKRRSALGLLGKHIDTKSGEWTETISGPGSNADSFYEYLLKMYVLFGDMESLDMFDAVYSSVMEHNKHGDWYGDVSMWDGCGGGGNSFVFDNLVAFWPGMQSLVGDLDAGAASLNAFFQVWREFSFLPEQFDVVKWRPKKASLNGYPLRPELLESTYYLHAATRDPSWLAAGAMAVQSLERYSKTTCGYASIADVESRTQEDAMPSFFLSETCKYLYLLFDETNFVRQSGKYVFTTEAHPFPILSMSDVAPIVAASNDATWPPRPTHARSPTCRPLRFYDDVGFRTSYDDVFERVRPRCDLRKVKTPVPSTASAASPEASTGSTLFGGKSLGYFNVEQLVGGFRARRLRLDHKSQWMKVTNLGDPQIVVEYQTDSSSKDTEFRIFDFERQQTKRCRITFPTSDDARAISCSAAQFGYTGNDNAALLATQLETTLAAPADDGCAPLAPAAGLVVMRRGHCFFDEKVRRAQAAGAAAAVVVNTDEVEEMMIMGPSSSSDDHEDTIEIPAVMVPLTAEARLRAEAAAGHRATLDVQWLDTMDFPKVVGTRYDLTVWGDDGWGLKLAAKAGAGGTPLWTISIADASKTDEKVVEGKTKGDTFEALAEKLQLLGFSDDQLALVDSDDEAVRLKALVDGLRAIGLEDVAEQLVGAMKAETEGGEEMREASDEKRLLDSQDKGETVATDGHAESNKDDDVEGESAVKDTRQDEANKDLDDKQQDDGISDQENAIEAVQDVTTPLNDVDEETSQDTTPQGSASESRPEVVAATTISASESDDSTGETQDDVKGDDRKGLSDGSKDDGEELQDVEIPDIVEGADGSKGDGIETVEGTINDASKDTCDVLQDVGLADSTESLGNVDIGEGEDVSNDEDAEASDDIYGEVVEARA